MPEPNPDGAGFGIDISHHGHLLIALGHVALVDRYYVDPYS